MCPAWAAALAAGVFLALSGPAAAEPEEAGDLTASELVREGRAAFEREDFARAEKLLDQLIADYGSNAEVAPLVDECLPMLAMCRVKRGEFDEALELIGRSLADPKLPAEAREELLFWRGICLMQEGEVTQAQEQFGEYFADESHDRVRRYEAFLLFGSGYLQLEDWNGAADFFADQIPKLPPDMAEVAGRARVLLLHSLTSAERYDEALALVRSTFPLLPEMTQVAAFQLLTLQLGGALLENDNRYAAIACLHRLWPRDRLIRHQRERQAEWEARRDRLRREGARREAVVFRIDGILARIRRELEQFEAIEHYDASVQLRLAQAFIGLDRWREAAAILDRAVDTLPDSPILQEAALTCLECWQQVPRWDRALEAADRCLARFFQNPDSPGRAEVVLARAEALRGLQRIEDAERQFGDFAHNRPDDKLAPRALFMGGICQLELDRSAAAVATFQLLRNRYENSALVPDSLYWEGMALTFQKSWQDARERLAECIDARPNGPWADDAAFERARCLHNQLRHEEAAKEFRAFLKRHRSHPRRAEALLLLGESLLARGELEAGIAELRKVPEDEERMYEEAQFRAGEAMRKLGEPQQAFDHFAAFIAKHPHSRRLAEAVLCQGRASQDLGRTDEARELYWDVLLRYGDDPAAEGVEDLLLATRRLYPGRDGIGSLVFRLDQIHRSARTEGHKTLAARALWARGHLLRESDPDAARVAFMQLGDLLDPAIHHPRMLADCADARREAGAVRTARDLYENLRRWHPRAIELERSSLGLGLIALTEGEREKAMEWFVQCGGEAVTGSSAGDALLERAALLEADGKTDDAVHLLESIPGDRLMNPRQKARSLLALGRIAMDRGELERAATLFERCYLSGARHHDLAADARLRHGLALEAAGNPDAAAAAYRELLDRPELASQPAAVDARRRLNSLPSAATP